MEVYEKVDDTTFKLVKTETVTTETFFDVNSLKASWQSSEDAIANANAQKIAIQAMMDKAEELGIEIPE